MKFFLVVVALLGALYAVQQLFLQGVQYPCAPSLIEKIRTGAKRLHVVIGIVAAAIVLVYLLRLSIYLVRSW